MRRRAATTVLFLTIFIALLACCTPSLSWANLDVDLFDFLYSGTTLNVAHPPGLPLYVLLSWVVLRLPGNEVWNLAFFLSVLPTMITCALIYKIISKKTTAVLAPFVGTLAFAGSMVVFSQAIIPEIYALECMFIVGAYYCLESMAPRTAMISLGCALAISWGALILVPIFVWRYWKMLGPTIGRIFPQECLFLIPPLLTYLYIPLCNRAPHLSLGPGAEGYKVFFTEHGAALLNLAAWMVPERVGLCAALIVASLGLAVVLAIMGLRRNMTLLWLVWPGMIFYITTRGEDALVQLVVPLAFAAIAAGLALDKWKWKGAQKFGLAAVGISGLLLVCNTIAFDIGVGLDPQPTQASSFIRQLDQLEDDDVIVCWHAQTIAGVYWYNTKNDKHLRAIHPVFIDPEGVYPWENRYGLVYDWGQGKVKDMQPSASPDWSSDYDDWAASWTREFANHNPGVTIWMTVSTPDHTEMGVYVVPAQDAGAIRTGATIPETHAWEYAAVLPWAYHNVSGYYAMSTAWQYKVDTNFTIGILALFMAFGGVFGYLAPKKLFKRLSPPQRTVATAVCTLILTVGFCFVLSLAGVPGFRWAP